MPRHERDAHRPEDRHRVDRGSPRTFGFLKDNKFEIAEGDELEVLGSRVTMGAEDIILAREITRGPDTVKLRDASGRQLWRTGRR